MPGRRAGVAGRRRRGGPTGGKGRGRPRGMGVPGNVPEKPPGPVARKKKRR